MISIDLTDKFLTPITKNSFLAEGIYLIYINIWKFFTETNMNTKKQVFVWVI